jgi:hypothetical protein
MSLRKPSYFAAPDLSTNFLVHAAGDVETWWEQRFLPQPSMPVATGIGNTAGAHAVLGSFAVLSTTAFVFYEPRGSKKGDSA